MPIKIVTSNVKKMSCRTGHSPNILTYIPYWETSIKANRIIKRIEPYIPENHAILDIGAGVGTVACKLMRKGHKVVCLDIDHAMIYFDINLIIYDGTHFPFRDNHFDVAILINSLHHCQQPKQVFQEAARVAKRLIVIEDTFVHPLEKWIVAISDSLGNMEFYMHNYMSISEWQKYLETQNFNVINFEEWKAFFTPIYARYCMFVIEKK